MFVLNRNLPFPGRGRGERCRARAIAKLIVDSGYTRPAILKGDDAHRSSKERLAGVMEVLDEAGITVDPKAVANGKFSRTDGYAAVMQMARSGLLKPGEGALYDGKGIDSIIALNDVMAIGAMTALRANGIEPGRKSASPVRRHPLLRRRVSATDHRASAAGRNGPGRRGQHPVQPR